MVNLPQQLIPSSTETTIISEPQLAKRLYGPATPAGSGSPAIASTIYTVPEGKRATVTMLLACNIDASSPLTTQTFSLSIGVDSLGTRIFNNCEVDAGIPLAIELDLTLEEGEFIQAAPAPGVTITLNGLEFDV